MRFRTRLTRVGLFVMLIAAAALVATGCGKKEEKATTAGEVSAEQCQKDNLETFKPGVLTVGTDKPAYPPYFEDDDPSNGKGFESAVAYAVATKLGFEQSDVKWAVVPFNSSYAPGAKKFDFDINQISKNADREKAVDFSSTYYTTPQAVVAPKGSKFADASSLADLKDATIGVQVGTTSLDAVKSEIDPSSSPKVFNDSNDVVMALKQKQVDAVVVDLPSALYLTAAQVPSATVVGQFSAPGGDNWGVTLAKGSSLTKCVSWAIDQLRESGELKQITDEYLGGETAKELS